jgi:uncharacterized OB-fold protein
MQTCPDCHALVDDQLTFCDNCGFRLSPEEKELPSPIVERPTPPIEEKRYFEQPREADLSIPQGACSACGYINLPGETFCDNCGVQLAPVVSVPPPLPVPIPLAETTFGQAVSSEITPAGVCTYCGYVNDPGETYCMNCGLQLSTPVAVVEVVLPGQKQPEMIAPPVEPTPSPFSTTPLEDEPPLPEEKAPVIEQVIVWGKMIVGESGTEIYLPQGKAELLIGRSDPVRSIFPDVDLTLHGGELSGVSRMHARLVIQGSEKTIEDLNSTNYTFLNRQKLEPGQRYPLHSGDEIRLGLLNIKYLAD